MTVDTELTHGFCMMRGRGLVAVAVHVCLVGGCFGAAVDAPTAIDNKNNNIDSNKNMDKMTEVIAITEATEGRFARSVGDDTNVYNFLGEEKRDHGKAHEEPSEEDSDNTDLPWQQKQQNSRQGWHLEPQVKKRDGRSKRKRGWGGNRSSSRTHLAGGPASTSRAAMNSYHNTHNRDETAVREAVQEVGRGAAQTVLARSQRTGRRYDVPQIGEFLTRVLGLIGHYDYAVRSAKVF